MHDSSCEQKGVIMHVILNAPNKVYNQQRASQNLKLQKGQGLIEYIILVAIIAVASIGIIRSLGQVTSTQFANITQAMQGKSGRKLDTGAVNSNLYKKKDLSDFTSNSSEGSGGWQ